MKHIGNQIGKITSLRRVDPSIPDALKQSIKDEQEAIDLYFTFAALADSEGKRTIAQAFRSIAKEERVHRERFQSLLNTF